MDKKSLICTFTGHRPHKFPWKYDEADKRCVRLKAVLVERIEKIVESGVTDFLSGMAQGTDLWAAQAVLVLRKEYPALKLHCILPCEGQESVWSFPAQDIYHFILAQANSVVYVSRAYHKGCMLERNRYLVDHSDILLAVYNGERRGGTAATVRYAQKMGKEVYLIDPNME